MKTLNPGDVVRRIYGDGFMETEMRVEKIDEEFIYCDAQRKSSDEEWSVLPPSSERWKFDVKYGVETDESQGWGMKPYAPNIVLSRIEVL